VEVQAPQVGGESFAGVRVGQMGEPGGRGVECNRVGRLSGFDGQGDSQVGLARAPLSRAGQRRYGWTMYHQRLTTD